MGTNTGGLIIPFQGTDDAALALLEKIAGKPLFVRNDDQGFKSGNETDFTVDIVKGYMIIHHSDYAHSLFYQPGIWEEKFKRLELLDRIYAFLRVDSANAAGYAIYENAKQIRCFEQGEGESHQSGEALPFEREWLNAPAFYMHEFQDEQGEYHELKILEASFNEDEMGEWEDYYKCRYIGDDENYLSEDELSLMLLNTLFFDLFGMSYCVDNPGENSILLSTLEFPEVQTTSEISDNGFFAKLKRFFSGQ